jgi:hypothetical protein
MCNGDGRFLSWWIMPPDTKRVRSPPRRPSVDEKPRRRIGRCYVRISMNSTGLDSHHQEHQRGENNDVRSASPSIILVREHSELLYS